MEKWKILNEHLLNNNLNTILFIVLITEQYCFNAC